MISSAVAGHLDQNPLGPLTRDAGFLDAVRIDAPTDNIERLSDHLIRQL